MDILVVSTSLPLGTIINMEVLLKKKKISTFYLQSILIAIALIKSHNLPEKGRLHHFYFQMDKLRQSPMVYETLIVEPLDYLMSFILNRNAKVECFSVTIW